MRVIKEANLDTIKQELKRMLSDGIADPTVRSIATSSAQKGEEIISVFCAIKADYVYTADPYGKELFTSPKKLIEQYEETGKYCEDCDGAALLMASLLGSIGFRTRIALLDCDYDGEYDHAIAEVFSVKTYTWINLDLTSDKPMGWSTQYLKRTEIGL